MLIFRECPLFLISLKTDGLVGNTHYPLFLDADGDISFGVPDLTIATTLLNIRNFKREIYMRFMIKIVELGPKRIFI